jgi:VanZ family protein
MVLIFVLSAQPKLPQVPVLDTLLFRFRWEDWSDKIKHFAAYAVLGWLVWRSVGDGCPRRRRLWLAIGISAVYGASDEFHQRFVANRTCDICDWTADVLGASFAAIILFIGGERWQRNERKTRLKRKPTKSKTRGA